MNDDSDPDDRELDHVVAAIGDRLRARQGRAARERADDGWDAVESRPELAAIREQMERFRERTDALPLREFSGTVLQGFSDRLRVIRTDWFRPQSAPEARDLLHVYGPDRDGSRGRYLYRFAWVYEGFNSIVYAKAPDIVRSGLLQASAYAYSGEYCMTIVGAGMVFIAEHGAARVSVRPYLPWTTIASFTHSTWDEEPEDTVASVSCDLGILVDSWRPGDTTTAQECDTWIPAYAHSTRDHAVDVESSGTATVGDGLVASFVAVPGRRYAIYIYALLQATTAPQVHRNETRFCIIDLWASVPFVVAQETLL